MKDLIRRYFSYDNEFEKKFFEFKLNIKMFVISHDNARGNFQNERIEQKGEKKITLESG